MRRQLILVCVISKRRVAYAHRDDLVVNPLFVAHAHDADRARLDNRQRVDRLLPQHERVERIAVVAERPRDEPVVGGVVDGAIEDPIEPQ